MGHTHVHVQGGDQDEVGPDLRHHLLPLGRRHTGPLPVGGRQPSTGVSCSEPLGPPLRDLPVDSFARAADGSRVDSRRTRVRDPPVPALQSGDKGRVLPGKGGGLAVGDDHRDNHRVRGGLGGGLHDRHLQLLFSGDDHGLRGAAQRSDAGHSADNLRILEDGRPRRWVSE